MAAQNSAMNGAGGQNNLSQPVIIPVYLPSPGSFGEGNGNEFTVMRNKKDKKNNQVEAGGQVSTLKSGSKSERNLRLLLEKNTEDKENKMPFIPLDGEAVEERRKLPEKMSPINRTGRKEFIRTPQPQLEMLQVPPLVDIMVLVERARFLPDSVNLTKIRISFYDHTGKRLGAKEPVEKMIVENEDVFSPLYEAQATLTKSDYTTSSGVWLFIELYSLDVGETITSIKFSLAAYCLFPLLVTSGNRLDPTLGGFDSVSLNRGEFQIPFYSARQTRGTIKEMILEIR